MELVISDNANTDNTQEVIRKFAGDPRVKTVRLESPVSVTENWNRALLASAGEYVLMIGDDDCLLPGYFQFIEGILDRYNGPDCVVHNAYSYVAPNAIAGNSESFYCDTHFHFGPDLSEEGLLTARHRFKIVCDMFAFKVRIPLNMQTTLFRRDAFVRHCAGAFEPPFPDHYALNSLLLGASSWVFSPAKPLVVGISPKSFGHYVYSNQQSSGLAYLRIATDFEGRLPGSELLNGMHVWLNLLKQNYPKALKGVEIDRAGYVRRQFYAWFMQRRLGGITTGGLLRNLALLSFLDWIGLLASVADMASWRRLLRVLTSGRKKTGAEAQWHGLRPLSNVTDIQQFTKWLVRRQIH